MSLKILCKNKKEYCKKSLLKLPKMDNILINSAI